MKGYFSFILVFVISLLLISAIELYQTKYSFSLSKAIISERSYEIGSNYEHAIKATILSGAKKGFDTYDATHSISMCNHCPDYFCNPTPSSTNYCDAALCSLCFRDSDAVLESKRQVVSSLSLLSSIENSSDFSLSFNIPDFDVFLVGDSLSKNGVSFSSIRTAGQISLLVNSSKFQIYAKKTIPSGLVQHD